MKCRSALKVVKRPFKLQFVLDVTHSCHRQPNRSDPVTDTSARRDLTSALPDTSLRPCALTRTTIGEFENQKILSR